MKFKKISIIAIILAILYSALLLWQAAVQPPGTAEALHFPQLEYEQKIFDSSYVHTIDIQVSAADWEGLKKDALSKECIDSTVTIDGEALHHVGVRTKGNSTLLFNAAKGWDRFSLVLEFDAFQESQRYYGLDCLSLYNNMFDASTMKTYLCYEMMRSMGVPTPLCSFAAVHINGKYVGMYAASELFSESFALRNFGYDYGQIYKPEQFDIAAIMTGEVQNANIDLTGLSGDSITIDSMLSIPNDAVRLAYLGESLYAYEDIWRNASFNIGTSDKNRVVHALRELSEGDHPESVVDLDMLARYFAVNTFALNTDCYTTVMAHNYGLYEKDGILTMLPWDYDVALGNIGSEFGLTDPSIFINQPIDTPVFKTTVEERPMLRVLLESEEGILLYHRYLDELVAKWIDSGNMASEIQRLAAMIRPWVEQETLSIYTFEEHLLPEYAGDEVSMGALLGVLPQANENLHESLSLPALLGLIDWGQLLTMEKPESGDESSLSKIPKEDLIAAVMPYPIVALKLLLTALAVPVVLLWGLRFVRRRKKTRGGITHVV